MIVLNKKRIIFLISMLMISFSVILINGTAYGTDSLKSGHTVILDARSSVSQIGRCYK